MLLLRSFLIFPPPRYLRNHGSFLLQLINTARARNDPGLNDNAGWLSDNLVKYGN